MPSPCFVLLNSLTPIVRSRYDLIVPCARQGPERLSSSSNFCHAQIHYPPEASSSFNSAQISRQGFLHPILRANPFPKVTDLFCRLPLPTLFYKLEAANLGDLMRLWVRTGVQINVHLWLFKDSWRHTKHVRKQSALPTRTPSSSQSVFRAPRG